MSAHGTRARYMSGRCRCAPCKAANTAYNRTVDRRLPENRNKPKPETRYVPVEPLLARVESYTGQRIGELTDADIAEVCGVSPRTVLRWRTSRRVRVIDTDRIAIHMGWHPAVIWGTTWYIETAGEAA